MNDETVPSRWSKGYTHSADLVCWSCDGSGLVGAYVCGVCIGKGSYHVGCGGMGEMDEQHPALGGNCIDCEIRPVEEFSKAGQSTLVGGS